MTSTLPFSASRLAKVSSRTQSVLWTAYVGPKRTFSAHCCNINSDGIMGVSKNPVLKMTLEPNPVCDGTEINWNMTASYAPGSTISSWSIDMGGAGNDDYPSQTFEGTNIAGASGTYIYAEAGNYEVTAMVEEGLGKSVEMTYGVYVIKCPDVLWSYKSLAGDGVFFINWSVAVPVWEAVNNGLLGDALVVNKLIMDASSTKLPAAKHRLWIATKAGIYNTKNGGKTWFKSVVDDPEDDVSADDLNYADIVMANGNPKVLFVLGVLEAANEADVRTWLFKTTNGGLDYTSIELVTQE